MSSISYKADSETIARIIEYYQDFKVENDNQYIVFSAKTKNCNISIYSTNTVLFMGSEANSEYNLWRNNEDDFIESLGSDEVGCGDFFGPIVVVSSYVNSDCSLKLIELGIKDSKKLSDVKIKELAPKIMELIPYSSFVISVSKYNEMIELGYNLNKIKAILHNFVLEKLSSKLKYKGFVIVDDFCGKANFYKYLSDYPGKVLQNINFETKAEDKYLSVGASSIIARYLFLNEMDKINKKFKMDLPLGASSKVDEVYEKLKNIYSKELLDQYVKKHFKNYKKLEK